MSSMRDRAGARRRVAEDGDLLDAAEPSGHTGAGRSRTLQAPLPGLGLGVSGAWHRDGSAWIRSYAPVTVTGTWFGA